MGKDSEMRNLILLWSVFHVSVERQVFESVRMYEMKGEIG